MLCCKTTLGDGGSGLPHFHFGYGGRSGEWRVTERHIVVHSVFCLRLLFVMYYRMCDLARDDFTNGV